MLARFAFLSALIACLFAFGCGGEFEPNENEPPENNDPESIGTPTFHGDIVPEQLEREQLNLVRSAIEMGLQAGKSLVSDSINMELARRGISHNYVGGEAMTEIPEDVLTQCPYVENVANDGSTATSCRVVAMQARDTAYLAEADVYAALELGPEFHDQRALNETWLRNGFNSGMDGEYLMAVRRLREAMVCDQEPSPVESSREQGVALGRQLFEEVLEDQLSITPVTVCDIDNGIVNPALNAALARVTERFDANPLCGDYSPTDAVDRARFQQAQNEYRAGMRSGVEEGAVIGSEQLFRTWQCQTPQENEGGGGGGGGGDPLVLDLDGDGVRISGPARGVNFVLGEAGMHRTGWVADSDDGFLVIDHNGNGTIDNGTELLGDQSWNPTTLPEANGLLSLANYDHFSQGGNGDGVINEQDAVFGALQVWRDSNLNGRTDEGELLSLSDVGIETLALDYTEGDQTLNTTFERLDGSAGAAVDVWFRFF